MEQHQGYYCNIESIACGLPDVAEKTSLVFGQL